MAGSRKPLLQKVREFWAIVGRRGGKSRVAGALAVYLSLFVDHSERLAKGETGYVLVLAPTVAQSKLVFTYARAFIGVSPLLAAVFDASAFWNDEQSALSDREAYRAVLPALATTGGMLIDISTPYRKIGLLYQKHRDHFGADDDDVLVAQGPSLTFNPLLSKQVIASHRTADPGSVTS